MRRTPLVLTACLMLTPIAALRAASSLPARVPKPASVEPKQGSFVLSEKTVLVAGAGAPVEARKRAGAPNRV
jgi:hypothetical protein